MTLPIQNIQSNIQETVTLQGDAQTYYKRACQLGIENATKEEAALFMTGKTATKGIFKNLNYQIGREYFNPKQYVTSDDDEQNILYKLDGEDSCFDFNYRSGTGTFKDSGDIAKDMGLVDQNGKSVATFLKFGKDSIAAYAIQHGTGVEFAETIFDLTSSSFNSKWKGNFGILNVDLDESNWSAIDAAMKYPYSTNLNIESEVMLNMLLEAKQILGVREYTSIINGATSREDMYEKIEEALKSHCFKVDVKTDEQ